MGHIHGNDQYDFTVSGIIIHENKVLMVLHHKLQLWLSPGGHIELNETPLQALYREIEEETGLTRGQLTLRTPYTDNLSLSRDEGRNSTEPMPFDIDIHPLGDEGHRHIDFGYILQSDTDEVHLEVEAADNIAWFSLAELETLQSTVQSNISRAIYALEYVGSTRT